MISGMVADKGQEIIIKKILRAGGGYIGAKETLEDFAVVKGILNYLSGEKQIKNDKLQVVATHKLYLEFRSDIEIEMAIIIDSKKYDIAYIENPMDFNGFLTLYLKESD